MIFLSKYGESEDSLFKEVKPPKVIPPDEGDAKVPFVAESEKENG